MIIKSPYKINAINHDMEVSSKIETNSMCLIFSIATFMNTKLLVYWFSQFQFSV